MLLEGVVGEGRLKRNGHAPFLVQYLATHGWGRGAGFVGRSEVSDGAGNLVRHIQEQTQNLNQQIQEQTLKSARGFYGDSLKCGNVVVVCYKLLAPTDLGQEHYS
jgi:hypothetical protein